MKTEVLETDHLVVGYPLAGSKCKAVCKPFSMKLYGGELVCLLGTNGAGKSTLLRTLAGSQKVLEGSIKISGIKPESITARELARKVAVVLTTPIAVPNLSVEELISLGRYSHTNYFGMMSAKDHALVESVIQAIKLEPLRHRKVDQLSDGERQKVMIARALAQEPELLLLDEPTAFLDLPRRVEILHLLRQVSRENNCAVLLSTHDLEVAMQLSDQIWLFTEDGTIQCGSPEDLILNGAFERAFQTPDLRFNAKRGALEIHRTINRQIGLKGEGLFYRWTKHALQREGFEVVEANNNRIPFVKVCEKSNDSAEWQLYEKLEVTTHDSVYSLIRNLRVA